MRSNLLQLAGAFRTEALIGALLMLLGLTVMCGWLLQVPEMIEIRAGLVPMVFNTGFCFSLVGAVIVFLQSEGRIARSLRLSVGIFLVLFCSLTLAEFILDRDFGINLAGLHTWYDYGNTRPGLMAPNAALGFILTGSIILLQERVARKAQALALLVLTIALLAVGLTGLVGYLLAPDLLFGWAKSARMTVHAAIGTILGAAAFWLACSKSDWYQSQKFFREDAKIRFLGSAILVIMTMTVGLVGFALLQKSLERTLENDLQLVVRNRVLWFKATVDEVARHSATAVRLADLDQAGRALLLRPRSGADRARFTAIGSRLIKEGLRGVALQDTSGKPLQVFGTLNEKPEMAARLDADEALTLLWDKEMVLRMRLTLMQEDKVSGVLIIDRAVPALNHALFDESGLGVTGETAACIRYQDALLCFPGNKHTSPYVARRSKPGTPLPMEVGFAGKDSIIYTLDYRGKNVIAAYGLLAPGLGFIAKQDTIEVYAVIRKAFAVGVPIILLVALLGAIWLHSQLKPLARKMRISEATAREKELEMRTIMNAAGDGILAIDQHGVIQTVNVAANKIFGYAPGELVGKNITALMPKELRSTYLERITQLMAVRSPTLVSAPNIEVKEVTGLRKDGSEFPFELSINEVPLSGKRQFVGVMRDITERKEAERKLAHLAKYDSLTGLPNRSLFMDRLSTAMLRAKRAKAAVALMFLDLDGFKKVNDTLGHQAGDELLIQVARRLSVMVRETDTVARLAGDEFTIILEKLASPKEDAKAIAEKIIESMQSPFPIAGHEVKVTVSIGLVLHDTQAGHMEVEELLHRADQEMYAAKHAGKNTLSMA